MTMRNQDVRIPLEPGTRVAEYVIESLLSRGGCSLTYFARKPNGTKCVIKEGVPLDPSFFREGERVTCGNPQLDAQKQKQIQELFAAEVEKANHHRTLNDNNSERIFEHTDITCSVLQDPRFAGSVCSYICIDTSYGKTLFDMLDNPQFSLKSKLICAREAAVSIHELVHSKGFLHADITPRNLFFPQEFKSEQTFCKLIDFGSSVRLSDLGENTWLSQSETFSAPEIVSFNSHEREAYAHTTTKHNRFLERIGFGSDIYSLGMVLLVLLLGKANFSNDEILSRAISRIKKSDSTWLLPYLEENNHVLAPLLTDLVKRCIYYDAVCFDKTVRPTATAFIKELNTIIEIINKQNFHPELLVQGSRNFKPEAVTTHGEILQDWLGHINR